MLPNIFTTERALYPLQMYKIKSLKNSCYNSSIFFKRLFTPKNAMIAHLEGPHLFLFNCQMWLVSIITFSTTNYIFLWATNVGCGKLTWISMGVIPLILLHFIRPFLRVDAWNKKLLFACFVLWIKHHNIYKFTIFISKLSLTIKKVTTNRILTMWLSSYITSTSIETKLVTVRRCTLSTSNKLVAIATLMEQCKKDKK